MRRTLIVTTLFVLVAGCGSSTTPPVQSAGIPGATGGAAASVGAPSGPTSAQPAESNAASGSGTPASPGAATGTDLPVFGTATYVADTAAAQRVKYSPADTTSTSVSVTDAEGTFWYLSVPAGALRRATTITMTPLKTITPTGMPGPILGGILLEPAGTTFFMPATLEANKGPAAKAAVLTGDVEGALRLAIPSATVWKRVKIDHFSPWYVVDASDPAWVAALGTLKQDGDAAAATAAGLLKQPLSPPAAPSIPFACPNVSGSSNAPNPIDAFVEQVQQPEIGLIRRLLAAAKQQQLYGASGGDQLAVVGQLTDRLVAKASAMLKATKATPDTLLPAATAALSTAKAAELFGGDDSTLLAAITPFVDTALADSIKRISTNHDYQQAQVVWDIGRMSALVGGKATGPDVEDALIRALRFDANLSVDESNPQATWTMGGIVPMAFPGMLAAGRDLLKGDATIGDISYHDTIGLTLTPIPFVVQASLADVDMCAGAATFGVDRFYMNNEIYKDETGGGTDLGRSWMNWTYFYGDKGGRDGWTWFAVKLHNGDAQWVNETIQAGDNGWFSEFSIVLNHTPG